jgi:hypothetical protein
LDYPEYWFEVDEYRSSNGHVLLAHLRFAQFNKSILVRVLKQWKVFRSICIAPLFAYAEEDAPKWRGFVALLGFKPTDQFIVCNNGERRRLFISLKELPNERQQQNANQSDPELQLGAVGTSTRRTDGSDQSSARSVVAVAVQ